MTFNSIESITILIRGNIIEIIITFRIIIISIIMLIVSISMSLSMGKYLIVRLIFYNIRILMRSSSARVLSHIFSIIIIISCINNIYSVLCICIEFYFFVLVYWWVIYIVGIAYCLGFSWYGLVFNFVIVVGVTGIAYVICICNCRCGDLVYGKRASFHVLGYWNSWWDYSIIYSSILYIFSGFDVIGLWSLRQ